MASAAVSHRLMAIVRQRCPRCLEGRVFTGWIRMGEACLMPGE